MAPRGYLARPHFEHCLKAQRGCAVARRGKGSHFHIERQLWGIASECGGGVAACLSRRALARKLPGSGTPGHLLVASESCMRLGHWHHILLVALVAVEVKLVGIVGFVYCRCPHAVFCTCVASSSLFPSVLPRCRRVEGQGLSGVGFSEGCQRSSFLKQPCCAAQE